MAWSDLLELSALQQAKLIARRELASEELTRLYLSRIEALNPTYQAFVQVWPEEALASAKKKDAQVRAGGPLPAFHGVPMGIKDLYLVRGHITRFGSRAAMLPAPVDCVTTRALRRGGFVLLGKTTTSEFGIMPVTEPENHAPTRNPWDSHRSAGGSSGGAGAAVACAMLPIAHASDGAGSIRIPASLGHLYGLKPSRGRVPNAFGRDDRTIMYTCGPLTRTVEDAAALLDVYAGLDVGKPHWLAPPSRPYAATWNQRPERLRVGLMVDNPISPTHPAMREAAERVARLLEAAGHTVELRTAPPVNLDEFMPIYQTLAADAPIMVPHRAQPITQWMRSAGKRLPRGAGARAQTELTIRLTRMMEGLDLMVSPTLGVPIPEIGRWRNLPPEVAFAEAAHMGAYTAGANITGSPAATIPAGLLEGRWPMGVQIVARPGEDALVLQVSHLLEQQMPWRGLWAPGAGRPVAGA
jgi:amidase